MDVEISELHAAYCKASGFDLPLRMGRDRAWFDFGKAGFTKEDLLIVIAWIRKQIPRGAGYSIHSLRFSTLLQLDNFEEKLLLARQEMRRRPNRPSTILREQRAGEIRRQVETPAEEKNTTLSDETKKFLAQVHARRAARLMS